MRKMREAIDWHERYDIRREIPVSSDLALYWAVRREDKKKALLRVFKNQSASFKKTLEREYEILKNIHSPKIIKIYDLEVYSDKIVSAMEGFGLEPLKTAFKKFLPVKIDQFLRLSISMAEVLPEIHKRKIAHHFINPSNILVDTKTLGSKSVKLKIGPFSQSCFFEQKPRLMKNDFLEPFAFPYIAPEKTGQPIQPIDHRADFYSLGVVLYELLTGKLPLNFNGDTKKIFNNIAGSTPVSPNEADKNIPGVVSNIIMKLLSLMPEERYQSSFGLIWDLKKCLRQQNKGGIQDFTIGTRDIPEIFQVSNKLYGREKELKILTSSFEEVAFGKTRITMIRGITGVGKTFLIDELRNLPGISERGIFIEGKFEFESGKPYSAVIQALRQLARYILSRPEDMVNNWRRELRDVLGDNLQIIIELIPEIEKIVGRQKTTQKLKPEETKNRFLRTFHNFVKLFCAKGNPLALFLDDLQRADISSLELIQTLAASKEIKYLFLIGAYRDNEVSKDHILDIKLNEIKKSLGKRHLKIIREISLKSLEESAVNEIVAGALYCETKRSKDLAKEVHKRSNGTPFFVKEFLRSLYDRNIFSFNHSKGQWIWKIEKIIKAGVSENVGELLSGNFENLSKDTQKYLKIASCIADNFSLNILCKITREEPDKIIPRLEEAVKYEIILPLKEPDDKGALKTERRYKFQHDNLRQNIHSFLDDADEQKINLQIGRVLLKDKRKLENKIIDVIQYLNKGRKLIIDSKEKNELAELNLAASKKAKSTAAYPSALEYIRIAESLLSPNAWKDETYDAVALDIYREYSECAYICGEFQEAEKQIKILLDQAKNDFEKSEIFCMRLIQYTVNGDMEEAIKAGIKALSFLGIELPEKADQSLIEREIDLINQNMAGKDVLELVELPELKADNDEKKKIILSIRILMELSGPAYLTGNLYLCALTAVKMVNISLCHGNHPFSAVGYATYGFMLSSALDKLKLGYEFGKLAIKVNKKNHKKRSDLKGRVYFMYAALIRHWNRPWESLKPYFEEAKKACLDSGDLFFASYTSNNMYFWDRENSLKILSKDYVSIVEDTKYQYALDITILMEQFQASLQGRTYNRLSLSGNYVDENILLEKMKKGKFFTGVVEYYMDKVFLCYVYEEYDKARGYFDELDKDVRLLHSILGLPWKRVLCFYRFLVYAASFRHNSKEWKLLEDEYQQIKKWSDNCPENFLHFRYLMEAEIARLSGKSFKAAELYKAAVEEAQTNNFPKYEAIANELASKFYIALKDKDNASLHMLQAIKLYAEWGATEKVKHLEKNYAYLLSVPQLEELLDKLTENVTEITGAQNVYILLMKNGTLEIKPEIKEQLPGSVIDFVLNSHQSIFLDFATPKSGFIKNSYIKKNNINSIFCLPILAKEELLGILSLENPLTAKKITKEQQVELSSLITPTVELYMKNSANIVPSDKVFKIMSEIRTMLPHILYVDRVKTADCRIFCVYDKQDKPSKTLRVSGKIVERYFPQLIKVHKSYIVNLDKISHISIDPKTKRYEATLDSQKNNKVPVGRKSLNVLRLFYPQLFSSKKSKLKGEI